MMTAKMTKLMRVHGNNYSPARSEARQAVVDAARMRQASAMEASRKRQAVTVSQRPRRPR